MIDFPKRHRVPYDGRFRIGDFDPDPPKDSGSEAKLEAELKESVERLDELQRRLFADERFALLAVFQAMDAAGKDSTIRKVFSGVNPAGFRVHAFGRPSELELRHDFLQRVAARLPERGKIGIFNRSHYEEVLVVRVHPEALGGAEPARRPAARASGRTASSRSGTSSEHLARNGTVDREVLAERLAQGAEEAPARAHRAIRRRTGSSASATSTTARAGTTTRPPTRRCCARLRAPMRRGTRFPPTTRTTCAPPSRASWSKRSSASGRRFRSWAPRSAANSRQDGSGCSRNETARRRQRSGLSLR